MSARLLTHFGKQTIKFKFLPCNRNIKLLHQSGTPSLNVYFQTMFKKQDARFCLKGLNKIYVRAIATTTPNTYPRAPFYKRLHQPPTFEAIMRGYVSTGIIVFIAAHYIGHFAFILFLFPFVNYHAAAMKIIMNYIRRDLIYFQSAIKVGLAIGKLKKKEMTVHDCFREHAKKTPNKIMLYFEDQTFTYKYIESEANIMSNFFLSLNCNRGDVVTVMVTNRPQFVTVILGLMQLGVVGALVNTQIRKKSLLHCINVAHSRAVVVSEDCIPGILEILDELDPNIHIFQLDGTPPPETTRIKSLPTAIKSFLDTPPEITNKSIHNDPVVYIYTSGTTGVPKAAILPNSKFILTTVGMANLLRLQQTDIIYDPLPLYHTTGLILGVGQAFVSGIPVVIRSKFSASHYWPDCKKYKCTVGQYIGEMCRYMLLVPHSPDDKTHNVKILLGNGLNRNTWEELVQRYNVRVTELYGATEVNTDGTIGAVGFVPKIVPRKLHPIALIRVDEEQIPIRGLNGLCERCDFNEPGMLIGLISPTSLQKFHGYVEKKSEKKGEPKPKTYILENIFKKGDKAFVTGDLLTMDKRGYLYFVDRTGDTYRWKGENVSTIEVETILGSITNHALCAVYGVSIPEQEGKAGMAVIVDPHYALDLKKLKKDIDNYLPPYARPLFLRLTDRLSTTGTLKVEKRSYVGDGFNPKNTRDQLYYRNPKSGEYEILTLEIYNDIMSNKLKL